LALGLDTVAGWFVSGYAHVGYLYHFTMPLSHCFKEQLQRPVKEECENDNVWTQSNNKIYGPVVTTV